MPSFLQGPCPVPHPGGEEPGFLPYSIGVKGKTGIKNPKQTRERKRSKRNMPSTPTHMPHQHADADPTFCQSQSLPISGGPLSQTWGELVPGRAQMPTGSLPALLCLFPVPSLLGVPPLYSLPFPPASLSTPLLYADSTAPVSCETVPSDKSPPAPWKGY